MITFLNETAIFQIAAKLFDDSSGEKSYKNDINNKFTINNSKLINNSENSINLILPQFSISTTFESYLDDVVKNNGIIFFNESSIFNVSNLPSYIDNNNNASLGFIERVIIGSFLLVLILFCVIGNFFVILAILLERDLRSRPQYYLIFSLAIADLLVGLVVTPLGAWSVVQQAWNLGVTLCDFWISVDVLLCTSSILHLVAIALDRYWSITDIYYVQNRTPKRIFCMLMVIWVLSLLISLAPIFGWKDAQFVNRVRERHVCLISQQISYQVFSTATAFYIPLCAIIIVYYKIMRAAKKRFRRDRDRRTINQILDDSSTSSGIKAKTDQNKKNALLLQSNTNENFVDNSHVENSPFMVGYESTTINNLASDDDERTPMQLSSSVLTATLCCESDQDDHHQNKNRNNYHIRNYDNVCDNSVPAMTPQSEFQNETQFINKLNSKNKSLFTKRIMRPATVGAASALVKRKKMRSLKETVETRRERKAWRTLAIITGTFVACWTPFFLVSLYRPICACQISPVVENVTNWLGYLNSALNPIIYTVFSMDFRMAFQRILKRLCLIKDF